MRMEERNYAGRGTTGLASTGTALGGAALCDILKEHGHDLRADQEIASLWHRAKSVFHIM